LIQSTGQALRCAARDRGGIDEGEAPFDGLAAAYVEQSGRGALSGTTTPGSIVKAKVAALGETRPGPY
jgi:hypothetical protein